MDKQVVVNFLDIALRKSAKEAIKINLQHAIDESGAGEHVTIENLSRLYGTDQSAEGLKQTAEYFLRDIDNPVAWREYFTAK